MYFFTILATPRPGTGQDEDAGGAYVNCWINFPLEDGAELLARFYIEQAGWVPGEKDDQRWVEEEDYEDEPGLLLYFREAEEDGASFVFHSWPAGEEGDEDEAEVVDEDGAVH